MATIDIPAWIQSWNWTSFVPDLLVALFTGFVLAVVVAFFERRASRRAAAALALASWEATLPLLAKSLPRSVRGQVSSMAAEKFIDSFSSISIARWAATTDDRVIQAASRGLATAHRLLKATDDVEALLREHCRVRDEGSQIRASFDLTKTYRNERAVRGVLHDPIYDPLEQISRWAHDSTEVANRLGMTAEEWTAQIRSIDSHPDVRRAWKTQVALEDRFARLYGQVLAAAAKSLDPSLPD